MKVFKPIVDKFKSAFFGGEDEDEECGNTGASKGRAKAGANPRKTPAPKKVYDRVKVAIDSDDEEVKQPARKRAKVGQPESY